MPRRWTVLIVPHGTSSTKSYEVGVRGLRTLLGAAAGLLLLVLAAGVTLPEAIVEMRPGKRASPDLN